MTERSRVAKVMVRVMLRRYKKWRKHYGRERCNNPIIRSKISYHNEMGQQIQFDALRKYGILWEVSNCGRW